MKSQPKVSVILPIFDVEEYLHQCVDSVINQTLEEMEIILATDGPETCDKICEEYAQKDSRIKILSHPGNYGLAINKGLEIAQGEYIGIVETDDFIEPDMFKNLYGKASQTQADIVKSAYKEYYDSTKETPEKTILRMDGIEPPENGFKITEYPQIFLRHPSIWSAIYRKDFLVKNNIKFIEKRASWIDNNFQIETLCLAQKIVWDTNAYYNYRMTNPKASSHLKDFNIPFDRSNEIHEFLKPYGQKFAPILPYLHKREIGYISKVIDSGFDQKSPEVKAKIDKMLERISEHEVLENDCFRQQERDLYFSLK